MFDSKNKREMHSGKKTIINKNSKSKNRAPLAQKNLNLVNIQMDLTAACLNKDQKEMKLNRTSSLSFKKEESSLKK